LQLASPNPRAVTTDCNQRATMVYAPIFFVTYYANGQPRLSKQPRRTPRVDTVSIHITLPCHQLGYRAFVISDSAQRPTIIISGKSNPQRQALAFSSIRAQREKVRLANKAASRNLWCSDYYNLNSNMPGLAAPRSTTSGKALWTFLIVR